MPAKGVERWLTQRLSHRLGTGVRGRRRRLRRRPVPQPALAGLDAARPRARRPVGPRPAGLAAARGDRRQPRRAVVRHARRPPRPRPRRRRRRCCGATAATPSPAGWPASTRRTPCSGPRWSPTGARAATPTAPVATLDDDLLLAGRAVAPAGRRGSTSPPPDLRHAETLGAPARGRRRARPARRGCRCSATPGSRSPRSSCCARSASRRDVHLWLPQPSPQLWDELAGLGGRRAPRRTTTRPSGSTTRCWPRWAATAASCAGRSIRWSTCQAPPARGRARRRAP